MKNKLKIYKKSNRETINLPQYQTPGSSGLDLVANLEQDTQQITIKPNKWEIIPTGITIELPDGCEAQIRPRSGLAYKYGVTVLNSPGTIDNDYRGEIKIILINHGHEDFIVKNGDRIAQMIISKYEKVKIEEIEFLTETSRNDGGFGSTGL
ncbi:MAG: dUTP diphosphatase [Rhodobiaceae bacterium]|nr:dUTP diphosphatase [Rhodobiaceae bacterium]RPF97776.1 MAG: dUTP diphosphatase [Rhizobiales bacterium TMED227]|tara:strand:+ start:803 stop:1258 length:456 start_codon:yes stop_codon:yes gene_type:complete